MASTAQQTLPRGNCLRGLFWENGNGAQSGLVYVHLPSHRPSEDRILSEPQRGSEGRHGPHPHCVITCYTLSPLGIRTVLILSETSRGHRNVSVCQRELW